MRILSIILTGVALLLAVPGATADEPKREPKPRFKGVEAYSWKDDKGVWQYAILDGTNRNKTEQEVKAAKTAYAGKDKFITALKLLAEGESVFWFHSRVKGFEYPPKDDLKAIDAAAKEAKITLERDAK